MSTNIYLIRHGQVYNKNNLFYGRLPRMALSNLGKEQMKSGANYLKNKNITKIFSSTLLRARQSADILSDILDCNNISRTNLITEINSYMEGKSFEFGKTSGFDHYLSPLRKPENETMDDIKNRMMQFINLVARKYKNKNIAVIAHGDPVMILKADIKTLPIKLESIRPGNGTYVKYGEIHLIKAEGESLTMESVFTPKI